LRDANWKAPKFTAVIDYHAQAESRRPIWQSRATIITRALASTASVYHLPACPRPGRSWIVKFNGEPMPQAVTCAAFIEDHIHEVASPTPDGE
jgi:hypothetical protein